MIISINELIENTISLWAEGALEDNETLIALENGAKYSYEINELAGTITIILED